MLRVLGSNKGFCDGLTRRDLLHVGSLPFGLTLADASAPRTVVDTPAGERVRSAKRCILLYLWGSPSQLETFDPKPDAPRGSPRRARVDPHPRSRACASARSCPASPGCSTGSRSSGR